MTFLPFRHAENLSRLKSSFEPAQSIVWAGSKKTGVKNGCFCQWGSLPHEVHFIGILSALHWHLKCASFFDIWVAEVREKMNLSGMANAHKWNGSRTYVEWLTNLCPFFVEKYLYKKAILWGWLFKFCNFVSVRLRRFSRWPVCRGSNRIRDIRDASGFEHHSCCTWSAEEPQGCRAFFFFLFSSVRTCVLDVA